MADTELMDCPFCGGAAEYEEDWDANYSNRVQCTQCSAEVSVIRGDVSDWNRRSTSSVSEGEMPELPKAVTLGWACDSSSLPMGYTADMVREYARAAIAADRRARQGEPVDVQRYTNNGDGTMVENPDGVWCYYEDATKAAAPADAPELAKLRDRVAELEAMLDARLERKPDNSQEWAKVDGAIAFHLIERHADDWNDAGRMMDAWRDANPRRASSVPAIPGARRAAVLEEAAKVCDSMTKLSRENAERHKGPNGEDEDGYVDAYLNKAMASAQCAEGIRAIKVAAPSHPSDVNAGENQQ